jgi:hypothetical protein
MQHGRKGRHAMYRPLTWAQPGSASCTVRYVEPSPKMPPEEAARLRALFGGQRLRDWELRRIMERYAGGNVQIRPQ